MADIITPNVGFVAPVDTSPMSDVDTYINNNWTKAENTLGIAKIVSSVPDTDITTYKVGDRIYVNGGSDPNGIYVCIEVNNYWGSIWRPVTPLYGPWRRPGPVITPNSVLADPVYYRIIDSDSPFQYRLTNTGTIEFRGCIQTDPANGTAFWKLIGTVGYNAPLFVYVPVSLRPGWIGTTSRPAVACNTQLSVAPYPVTNSGTEAQYAQVIWDSTQQTFVYRVFSNVNAIKKLFFSARYNLTMAGG